MTARELEPATIPELFERAVTRGGDARALGVIVGGQLSWKTWRELTKLVEACAGSLAAAGVRAGDRVAQWGQNSLEWIVADLAILGRGAVHVPLHAALTAAQVGELVLHSEARLVLAGQACADGELRKRLPGEVAVLRHQDLPVAAVEYGPGLRATGSADSVTAADDFASILYTSGTTGPPLGVMLTHRNLVSNAIAVTKAAQPPGDETRLCLLPLSHIYARTCDLYSWLLQGTRMVLAESRETIMRDCQLARPTVLNAVPYFYQKVADGLRGAGEGAAGGADALRAALGGAVRRCSCGGAALAPEVDRFFAERGLPILCGYGLTEASPVISSTPPGSYRPGTVGVPLPGVDVRLADDGEVLTRGPHVMRGYWRDEAATARAITDGWLSTGDLGEWDAAGHLRIIGRKKETIVLATGKNVAPTRIEQRLAGSPWIEQACVVGDGQKCLAAIIVPNGDALRRGIKRRRLWVWSRRRAVTHPQIRELYRAAIDECLSDLASFEQVGPFVILDRGFSLEHGEVTTKLSLCRSVIAQRFADDIRSMYSRQLALR